MIILRVRARNINSIVTAGYDHLNFYRDVSQSGPFTESVGTVALVQDQEYYEFTDPTGISTNWYKVSYSGDGVPESEKSSAINGSPVNGVLGVLTIGYVWDTTDIPEVSNLPGSKVAELIIRSEALLKLWGDRYGGYNTGDPQWSIQMPIAARRLAEELYLHDGVDSRSRLAKGLLSERIGTYQYTAMNPYSATEFASGIFRHITEEIVAIIGQFLLESRYKVLMTTTPIFTQMDPIETALTPQTERTETILWNDKLDIDFIPYGLNPGQPLPSEFSD